MIASVVYLLSVLARRLTPLSIMVRERTFIAVKPDGVQRGLVGEIIKRFEAKGFKLAGMKFLQATEDLLKQHYADLADKPFYAGLCKYMSSGPLVAMCWEGTGVVKTARTMMGETRPADSKPGTIRGDFCIEVGRNIIHGSDSVDSANKEIALWFKDEELFSWTQANEGWIYELVEVFGDVNTAHGLQSLNNYFEDHSYISGFEVSKLDLDVLSSFGRAPDEKYNHVLRWYNHIQSLGVELRLTLGAHQTDAQVLFENKVNEQKSASMLLNSNASEYKASNLKGTILDKTEENADDDEFDLFGSDDDDDDDKEAARVREERLKAYAEKKSKKPGPIAKSSVMLDVKPWDDETDMKAMEEFIRSISMDGLSWGASKLSPLAFGINKLAILCSVEDEKVSIDDLTEKICQFEELVQSVDIAAFNKI